jgi:GNAT superfamily N-acetyltransferase
VIGGTEGRECRSLRGAIGGAGAIEIETGSVEDWGAIAALHYRAGRPATVVGVLRAGVEVEGKRVLAGVLVVSMPTLNGAWRKVAWPELFGVRRSRTEAAHEINRHIRTISRVVVEPRFRGMSVGRRLVERYLADPMTACTETIAAMGGMTPMFERAGMRRVCVPRGEADEMLSRVLRRAGVRAERLVDEELLAAELRRTAGLERALRAWAAATPGVRKEKDGEVGVIAAAAAGRLVSPPMVFVSP